MGDGMWELWDDAASLDTAATGWSRLATALGDAGDTLVARSKDLMSTDWEGDAATSYAAHRKDLVAALDEASALASDVSSTLTKMAGVVRVAQGNLDLSWATVSGIAHTGSPSGEVRFQCEDDAELEKVNAAIARATEVRDGLDRTLAEDQRALAAAVTKWNALTSAWSAIANREDDPFTLPEDADGVGVITVGDQTFVNTGSGADDVKIAIDPLTGEQLVTINGQTYKVPADQEIVVRTGGDNDTIEVPKGTRVDVTILGGDGDDRIQGGDGDDRILGGGGDDEVQAGAGNDAVLGGAGRDYVDGQGGDDLLTGGAGNDTVYGLDGKDRVLGGTGKDYLEGGKDDDLILGGGGEDLLSGGRDDDTLFGGGGDDVAYAGHGEDTTYGGSGTDTSNEEVDDSAGDDVERTVTVQITDAARFIRIEGSPEFVARVEADLDMLRGSPAGQKMLAELQAQHDDSGFAGMFKDGITIREHPVGDNNTASPDGTIEYSPRRDQSVDERPPIVGLYHEMAHIYDFMSDNYDDTEYHGKDSEDDGIEQGERTAVGLPVDHDHDDKTDEQRDPDHPWELTENALRDELGWDRRKAYRG